MTLQRGSTGILVSDDETEVNPVCVVMEAAGALAFCPEWGTCACAVCTTAQPDEDPSTDDVEQVSTRSDPPLRASPQVP